MCWFLLLISKSNNRLQNMEIGLQSKINKLITPFQASGSGTLGALITFDSEVVTAIILPSWSRLPGEEFCFFFWGSKLCFCLGSTVLNANKVSLWGLYVCCGSSLDMLWNFFFHCKHSDLLFQWTLLWPFDIYDSYWIFLKFIQEGFFESRRVLKYCFHVSVYSIS